MAWIWELAILPPLLGGSPHEDILLQKEGAFSFSMVSLGTVHYSGGFWKRKKKGFLSFVHSRRPLRFDVSSLQQNDKKGCADCEFGLQTSELEKGDVGV